MGHRCMPGLDRQDDLRGLARRPFVVEVQSTVDALVCTLLLLGRASANKANSPPLELVRIVVGESLSILDSGWLANKSGPRRCSESCRSGGNASAFRCSP